jgi:hypothetical protein
MIGVSVASIFIKSEMFTAPDISIGQVETARSGIWKLSFKYFDGEKVRKIDIKDGKPETLNIGASVKKGTLELGISIDGTETDRISLNDLNSVYVWDLSGFPDNSKITLHLYGDAANGSVDINWQQ